MTRAYQARALHDGVKPGFRAVVDNPDGWPIAHCMALGDAEQIAAALNATPSQRLDAATVERCAETVLRREVIAVINEMSRFMPHATEDWRARLMEALA